MIMISFDYVGTGLANPNKNINDFLSKTLKEITMKYEWNYPKLRLLRKSHTKSRVITQRRKPKKR